MGKDLYLVRVWKQSKGIFFFILVFAALQLYFNQKRMNTFPFIVWDMYSRHQEVPKSGSILTFYLDGQRFDHTRLPIWQEETALHTFKLYQNLKQNPDADPMDELVRHRSRFLPAPAYPFLVRQIENTPGAVDQYPDWLFYYLRRSTQNYFHKLEVKELYYEYRDGEFRTTGKAYTHLVVQHD